MPPDKSPPDRPLSRPGPGGPGGAGGPAGPGGSLTLSPFLLLLDAQKNVLEGPRRLPPDLELKPINFDGATVGYLGYVRRTELVEAVDQVFARQQERNFVIVAAGMLVAAVVLAALIAQYLARPVQELARGTAALIKGRYEVRTRVGGRDELAQLAADFNTLARTLEANREARRQWIADIAHELRTPLAVLQAEVEAMQDGVRPLTREAIASLAQEVARLSLLVGDLQTLSLSDLGALSYDMIEVDLGEVTAEVIAAHRGALEDAGIAIEFAARGRAPVLGDQARLAQMLGNLAQNTRRYTDAPGRLRVAVGAEGEQIVLDWEDSSPGVAEADLPRLTDRLFRIEGSRSRDTGGAGLGLAIVRAIVDAHHGAITPRQGTLGGLWWRITLPRAAKAGHA